jgi:tetratricopeptide (TPR) repeat protein
MKKIILFLFISFFIQSICADTITTNSKIRELERQVKQIDTNQLNYKIEKDLLKETYSNNYERISLIITIVLGIMGVLGYLGLKDISTIKKEYEKELIDLRQIQGQFNLKLLELDTDKKKFEEELKSIIKENEDQSRKIKFLELKDKVRILLKDNSLTPALEFANAALNIIQEDNELLNLKGSILCRLNQLKEAVEIFNLALKLNPTDSPTILNTAECLYFSKDINGAKKLIDDHKILFENKENGRLLELFNIFELYFDGKKESLLDIAKSYVDFNNLRMSEKRMSGWNLEDALYVIHNQPESELKNITQNIIRYWNGQINGRILLEKLEIEIPRDLELEIPINKE